MSTGTNRRPLSAIAGLAAGVLAGTNVVYAQIPCGYDVTIIQSDLDCGGLGNPITIPTGMNELGYVVGYHYCLLPETAVPFLWSAESGFTTITPPPDLSAVEARDVNEDLQIVGYMNPAGPSGQQGFVLNNHEWTTLLPEGDGIFSGAFANNSIGQAAGYRDHDNGNGYFRYGFLWDHGAFTNIIPTYGPTSIANDVNVLQHVVGWMGQSTSDRHAFLWDDGGVADLGVIPGGFTASAKAINSIGQIAIGGKFNRDHPKGFISGGFLWDGGEWTDLGMLSGYDSMALTDVNDSATVVGWSRAINSSNAPDVGFVWREGIMTNLNELIPSDLGITIQRVEAIDNAGRIAARGNGPDGVVALLLTPIEPPLGDLDGDCQVGASDLLLLLASWGPCLDCNDCTADFDGDCTVGASDLLILLVNWG